MKPHPRRSVRTPMRLALIAILAACGGSKPTPTGAGSGSSAPVVPDKRPAIEKRRDAGCEALRPKLVACAAADSKAELDAGHITKKEYESAIEPWRLQKFGDLWMKNCQIDMSSRQVRVLEVCFKEETECGPLEDCLSHLNDKAEKPGK